VAQSAERSLVAELDAEDAAKKGGGQGGKKKEKKAHRRVARPSAEKQRIREKEVEREREKEEESEARSAAASARQRAQQLVRARAATRAAAVRDLVAWILNRRRVAVVKELLESAVSAGPRMRYYPALPLGAPQQLVYRGVLADSTPVAIKKQARSATTASMSEVTILRGLSHPYVRAKKRPSEEAPERRSARAKKRPSEEAPERRSARA
jgi:hypothetical protein